MPNTENQTSEKVLLDFNEFLHEIATPLTITDGHLSAFLADPSEDLERLEKAQKNLRRIITAMQERRQSVAKHLRQLGKEQ